MPDAALRPPLTPDDRRQIKDLGEVEWTAAFIAGNHDRLLQLCDENIVYMPADHPAIRGRAQLREWLATFPPVSSFEQPIEAIDGHGDVAMARATFTVVLAGTHPPVERTGKAMCSLHRSEGGWLITSVCWNFDDPGIPPPRAA